MFRKIVSNLSFSPALVGQLAFYAKRLRKEETTRRVGLVFIVLALVVQSLAVFQPPTSANATSNNDFVPGGLGLGSERTLNKFLVPYDANTNHLKDIMTYMGITRAEITATTFTSWKVGDKYSWGHEPAFSAAQGEHTVPITDSTGKTLTTVYARPNKLYNGSAATIYGWVGHSSRVGWFAIMQYCGNLMTDIIPSPPKVVVPPAAPAKCIYNGSILASASDCKPCPGNANLWISDKTCTPNIVQSKSALNVTEGNIDATLKTANSNDQIVYTITVQNTGLAPASVPLSENLKDVLEYSNLTDNGGGTFNATTKTLTWPTITLAAKAKQSRSFSVKVLDPIPATAQGQSDPSSYDCVMSNTFGNNVSIKVLCPTPKVVVEQTSVTVENTVTELPHTGPRENLLFGGIVLAIVTYFYFRSRQVKKEVRLIRRSVNSGTI